MSGGGINGVDVHELLDDIVAAGFVQDREVADSAELTWSHTLVA